VSAVASDENVFGLAEKDAQPTKVTPQALVSSTPLDIVVVTHFASPYQVELFNEVARLKPHGFAVYYLHRTHPTRKWSGTVFQHRAHFLKDEPGVLERANADFRTARLAVFNFYAEPPVPHLLQVRVGSGLPWCFWGERPGYKNILLGRVLRRWRLRALHASRCPVWGIGRWAVDAYEQEFGLERKYVNLPYFSDLRPFQNINPRLYSRDLTFLYSGSLSRRKGVDLLARAFCRVAAEFRQAHLKVMGDGELRRLMEDQLRNVAAQVEFIGFKEWQELPRHYAAADVLCVPSRYDGWGLVLPEGLAAGLPVIATRQMGSALEFIKSGSNGWLIAEDNEAELYQAMRAATALPSEQWYKMSEAARTSVKEHSLRAGADRFLAASRDAVTN
jgi:glycosyltransferase involved in cell wall biosynthesis